MHTKFMIRFDGGKSLDRYPWYELHAVGDTVEVYGTVLDPILVSVSASNYGRRHKMRITCRTIERRVGVCRVLATFAARRA